MNQFFWSRMAAQSADKRHQNLVTHPSDATRIANLKALIPEARALAAKLSN
jgi:predicted Zn-dependent protease